MYGEDRPDMQLEHDRSEGAKRDNYYADLNKPVPEQPFADSDETAKPVSQIVKDLVRQGGGKALYYNHQIYWDMELSEARQEASLDAITPDGWDTPVTELEQINVDGHAPGEHEYEITVEVYEQA